MVVRCAANSMLAMSRRSVRAPANTIMGSDARPSPIYRLCKRRCCVRLQSLKPASLTAPLASVNGARKQGIERYTAADDDVQFAMQIIFGIGAITCTGCHQPHLSAPSHPKGQFVRLRKKA